MRRQVVNSGIRPYIPYQVKVLIFIHNGNKVFLTYQLSQRRITCFLPLNFGITWRIIDVASSSFDSFFATYGIRAEQKGNGSCFYPISGCRALRLQNNGHLDSWNHYVPHGQKVWKHFQIFCRILKP